ncbi:uncharacterized protein [Anabrus simplex]|uniref:uncharacterized protein n=1 Tax=Anabrus simplex TaxID=316456 RepID=UPI0035A3A65D
MKIIAIFVIVGLVVAVTESKPADPRTVQETPASKPADEPVTSDSATESNCTSKICPTIYDPVCAEGNGEKKTFDTECEMEVHNCLKKGGEKRVTKVKNGEC